MKTQIPITTDDKSFLVDLYDEDMISDEQGANEKFVYKKHLKDLLSKLVTVNDILHERRIDKLPTVEVLEKAKSEKNTILKEIWETYKKAKNAMSNRNSSKLDINFFEGVSNPDMVEINLFGYDDFFMLMSKDNTNNLLYWFLSNYKHIERNLEKRGFTWCYLLEEVPDKHPFIYLFFGRDVTKITVKEFTKDTRDSAPENMTYSYCEDSLATIDLGKYFNLLERNCSDILYVHKEIPLENYKMRKRHVRHLSNEVNQSKTEEQKGETVISNFRSCIILTDKADEIMKLLHELMDTQSKPKQKMIAVRAAMEAGVIRRPKYEELISEFSDIKQSSWQRYTNNENEYTEQEKEPYISRFKALI